MNKKIIKKSCLVKKTKNYKFIIYTLKKEGERDTTVKYHFHL
jgi:hypothetical protein